MQLKRALILKLARACCSSRTASSMDVQAVRSHISVCTSCEVDANASSSYSEQGVGRGRGRGGGGATLKVYFQRNRRSRGDHEAASERERECCEMNRSRCALNGNSIPAAPALRMPACGGRLGVKFRKGGGVRVGCTCSGKVRGRYRGKMQTNGARAHLRSRSLPTCGSRVRCRRAS